MYKGIHKDIKIAKEVYYSSRWNYWSLSFKRLSWLLFGKRKEHKWNLPGPTSTSHPWGFISFKE